MVLKGNKIARPIEDCYKELAIETIRQAVEDGDVNVVIEELKRLVLMTAREPVNIYKTAGIYGL